MKPEFLVKFARAAEQELTRREILTSSLSFTKYFFQKRQRKKFNVGNHHRIISEALDRVIAGTCKRLIINLPPRYGKTELAVKGFIGKGLAHNPAAKFIHLSYSNKLALDNSEDVKDLVKDEFYRELFPDVVIKQGSSAKNKWYTTRGGGVYASSAGGQVTGFGAGNVEDEDLQEEDSDGIGEFLAENQKEFGGAIIIDDPNKPDDTDSDVLRDRVNYRFDSTIRNRVNSRNTPIIIIMQRLHPMDLSGYLMEVEPDEWEVISLPAITSEGLPLWEHMHTLKELEKIKLQNEIVFERQYMQDPKNAAGLLFPASDLKYFDPNDLGDPEYKYMAVDPSDTGGDDTAAPFAELHGNGIYIRDVIYNTDGTDINIPSLVDIICTKKPHAVEIEVNSAWILFGKEVRNKVEEKYDGSEIRMLKHTTNKQARILAESSFIRNHCYFLKEASWSKEYRKFMKVLTSYLKEGNNKRDDAADAMAMVAVYFKRHFADLW